MNILTKFGLNWLSALGEKDKNVKRLRQHLPQWMQN
jgi:hypothetical protein